ncbi:hypothetical protein [Streptomyces sp. enrichment culture]|uniref:hypothetical protein n=1 Tax=Streptomyces sp. enrichment culture TaxID=1795815 RepID=UPI003F560DA1
MAWLITSQGRATAITVDAQGHVEDADNTSVTASMPQQAGPASEARASDAGWEAPYYRVRAAGFQVLFLVEPDEAIEEVCNVDAEVHLADGR